MDNTARTLSYIQAKPILKWAGGKTQMLNDLLPKVPSSYGRYIEPFFGGGALFFALRPENAIIADSNPELVNMYRQVANNLDDVIDYLKKYKNTSEMFYQVRALEWTELPPAEAAARTIYLNRTCFNGLYRVNRKGQFNVPYGKYVNPKICDEENLHAVSKALQKAEIVCGDYLLVLEHYAKPGDFIFLDPPYLPISEYSDFKRYTKEQFYEEDHVELAKMVMRLHEMGCSVVLTNSNHPLVHELYSPFKIDVIQTKRHISCNGKSRKGEDVIVTVPPKHKTLMKLAPQPLPQQVSCYPPTRFMGSKSKLLSQIWAIASQFEFETAVDLFSGSGIVGYMFKAQGKSVISNDYMAMSATFTKAMIENNTVTLPLEEAERLLVAQNHAEYLGDALIDSGALSITLEDADADTADEAPLYGEPGLEPTTCAWKRSRLKFLIDEKSNPALLVKAAYNAIGQAPEPIESIVPVPEPAWVKLTQSQFGPPKVSDRLWIVPSWSEIPDPKAVNIRLDPGVAFGTGAHPTTHLCLKWLDENVRSGLSVLDYGCGTGILAIAAAKLGATPVVGTDIDLQAVEAACYNAKINAVDAAFSLPEALEHRTFDIVIANI